MTTTLLLLCLVSPPPAADELQKARVLFETYVQRGQAFDATLADLYSDDAVIRNKRTYSTGEVRELSMPASEYKELLRKALPIAMMRGDTSTFTEIQYTLESGGVRIKADRFSELKKYHSPISLLVKPTAT